MPGDVDTVVRSPVVETESGKIEGLTVGGVHLFKGIPYGAPTSGANRFLPPCPPAPRCTTWPRAARSAST